MKMEENIKKDEMKKRHHNASTTASLIVLTIIIAAIVPLSSCVKKDLYDTAHPDTGMITVTADWTERGEGVDIPDKWELTIGDYAGEETATTHSPDIEFVPGKYTLTVWNPADGITVSGTTATVESTTSSWSGVGSFVNNAPDWLFTSVQDVTIEADCDHEFTASMTQQVRELTLMITPSGDAADRIETISGYLSGVAGTMEFATDVYGSSSNVELSFTKITEGEYAGNWSATVWLLGITGTTQQLTATLTYMDGNPADTSLESDLSSDIAGFNSNKTVPLTLGGTMSETPVGAGAGATIDSWTPVEGGELDAK